MSLNAVFVIFMEFDIFRNVGLIHQGIYYLRVRIPSNSHDRIMYCKSSPCMKANICDNRPVQDAVNYYKPCSIDIESNSFITRSMLIRYQGEEVSMRDSCCWRVEVPIDSMDSSALTFTIDLFSHQPIKSDNRVIAYAEKATLIGSQTISISHIGGDSSINFLRLLYPEQGLCEVKGILHSSLVDIRYHQHSAIYTKPIRFGDFVAMGCDNYREVEERYTSMTTCVIEQLEKSYYHIVNTLQFVTNQFQRAESLSGAASTLLKRFSSPVISPTSPSPLVPESHAVPEVPESHGVHGVHTGCHSPPLRCGSPCFSPSSLRHSYSLDLSSKENSPTESFTFDLVQEDLRSVGENFANQLSTDILYCSNQLWAIHDKLVDALRHSIGAVVEFLSKQHELSLRDFYHRFALINRLDKSDVTGEYHNVLEDHLTMFKTVLHSPYITDTASYDIIGNDSLITFALTPDGTLQCPLLLVDRYSSDSPIASQPHEEPAEWTCPNLACKQLHPTSIQRCPCCLTHRSFPDLHVVFLLHGFHAEPWDMHHIADLLTLKYPFIKIVSLQACLDNTSKSLVILASMIAKEIADQLASLPTRTGRSIHRISFIGHSIGSIVLRLALRNPLLQNYTSSFHMFLSLNAPHLGVQFSKKTHEWGKKVLSLVNSSALVEELMLHDEKEPTNSLLYRMAKNTVLSHFKYFYLFSSCQDTFIPFHCVRSETTPGIVSVGSTESDVYVEMVKGFWKDLEEKECQTVIKKFDIYYNNINFSIDSIIGKTAHNNILRDVNAIQLLIYQIEECFH